MRAIALAILALAAFASAPLDARDRKLPEVAAPADAKPGKACLLKSARGMSYFLLVPRSYKEDEGARLVIFMHGSNMNGLQYMETINDERWCRNDILVCPNGEKGNDPYGGNNFTFGSAAYIKDITETVQSAFKVTRTYIGGHSQGGFVTYSAIMLYPDLFDGAFPMAADCWSQNEPNLWETQPEMLEKQREIAIAVIHGQADPIVKFSQGEHAHGIFLAMGYPKLRFFAPEKLGHQFGLSPVEDALEWLDAMTARDPEEAIKLARDWGRDKEWGWAHQACLAVLANNDADDRSKSTAESAIKAIEKKAPEAVTAMKDAMESKDAAEWIPEWYEFRRQFGATEAAKELVDAYETARAKERDDAKNLFQSALAHSRGGDKDAMKETLRKILDEAPHSYHAWYALSWLKED